MRPAAAAGWPCQFAAVLLHVPGGCAAWWCDRCGECAVLQEEGSLDEPGLEWSADDAEIAKLHQPKQVGSERPMYWPGRLAAQRGRTPTSRACTHSGLPPLPPLQDAQEFKSETELEQIAKRDGYGHLFSKFGTMVEGLRACDAVDSLVDASAIDTLLSNFIVPLQSGARRGGAQHAGPAARLPGAQQGARPRQRRPSGSPSLRARCTDDISKPDPRRPEVYRVHCSLNINTETGRLSARRPNLQNQPALEKDRYKARAAAPRRRAHAQQGCLAGGHPASYNPGPKRAERRRLPRPAPAALQVRKAFTADVKAGKTLIVADYGQLELRILAHMANCTSMIEAFKLGGDFHSRTALGMYDHIKEAIEKGEAPAAAARRCTARASGHAAGQLARLCAAPHPPGRRPCSCACAPA